MKAMPSKKVRQVLRGLGLRPSSRGNGTGHECWIHACGRTCRPLLRKRELAWNWLYALGSELEAKGICSRRAFLDACRQQ